MNSKIYQDIKDLLEQAYSQWQTKKNTVTFEEYVLPVVAMNLALQYNPEEVAVAVRDKKVKALLKFYLTDGGIKQ
jgi:hypothetical protein